MALYSGELKAQAITDSLSSLLALSGEIGASRLALGGVGDDLRVCPDPQHDRNSSPAGQCCHGGLDDHHSHAALAGFAEASGQKPCGDQLSALKVFLRLPTHHRSPPHFPPLKLAMACCVSTFNAISPWRTPNPFAYKVTLQNTGRAQTNRGTRAFAV